MSGYGVVAAVSEVLRTILWKEFMKDKDINPEIVSSESDIVFSNPTETARNSSNRLSIWLYQIVENEFLKNQAPIFRRQQPSNDSPPRDRKEFPPLALNFFYLFTPFASSAEHNHLLIGKTLQIMYDNSTLLLRDQDRDSFEELRIILCRLSLDELTRIWEALKEPYRLSVCYEVRVTRVDSQRRGERTRVVDRLGRFQDEPVSAEGL